MTFNFKLLSLVLLSSLAMGIEAGKKSAKATSERSEASNNNYCTPPTDCPSCDGQDGRCCENKVCENRCDSEAGPLGFEWCLSPAQVVAQDGTGFLNNPPRVNACGKFSICFSQDLSQASYTLFISNLDIEKYPNQTVSGAWLYQATPAMGLSSGAAGSAGQGLPIFALSGLKGFGFASEGCPNNINISCKPKTDDTNTLCCNGLITNANFAASEGNASGLPTVAALYAAILAGEIAVAVFGNDSCDTQSNNPVLLGIDGTGGILRGAATGEAVNGNVSLTF